MTSLEDSSDGRLLAAYVQAREESAFAEIVRRHGALVLNTCRHILGHTQDAEDAAQAVFLTLARKAASLTHNISLAAWLQHIAYCISIDARKSRTSRIARERKVTEMARPEPQGVALSEESWMALHGELAALPEKYRQAVVLFHMEERPLEEIARLLSCPLNTAHTWLRQGREKLKDRLLRRGLTLSVTALVSLLSFEASAAEAPVAFVSTTTKAAMLVAAGKVAAAGGASVVSAKAAALADGAVKRSFWPS